VRDATNPRETCIDPTKASILRIIVIDHFWAQGAELSKGYTGITCEVGSHWSSECMVEKCYSSLTQHFFVIKFDAMGT
jgi:hypothetical protein